MEKICVVGLGYVGLPLAAALSEHFDVIGFDINPQRLVELRRGYDNTGELSEEELIEAKICFVDQLDDVHEITVFIVTVPTPIDTNKVPDLSPLKSASEKVGKSMEKGSLIIYESTVFPGATEEICVPILEKFSGLKYNVDFQVGYSPERMNPGDKIHTVDKIIKVTSGSNQVAAERVDKIYKSVTSAGTYLASSIKVAEASKVIENTQRDLNIAFVNELCQIFDKLDIDTEEILLAAGTKWNFLNFKPGLVGGHCIGVDPYYLTQKAAGEGIYPELVLAGRRVNENMPKFAAQKLVKYMVKSYKKLESCKIIIFGCTFKENCPDFRNSKVFDLADELKSFGFEIKLVDPYALNYTDGKEEIVSQLYSLDDTLFDAAILAVAHEEFVKEGSGSIRKFLKPDGILYDLKYTFPYEETDLRL